MLVFDVFDDVVLLLLYVVSLIVVVISIVIKLVDCWCCFFIVCNVFMKVFLLLLWFVNWVGICFFDILEFIY